MFVSMKSRMSLKMGQKLGQVLVRMFVLKNSWTSLKKGHVGSKTRSQGQILQKPCVCSRDLFIVQILIKLGQNVYLDNF